MVVGRSGTCTSGAVGSLPLFFFYWYGDHRDLHSFPTRRSSDLGSLSARSINVMPSSPPRRRSVIKTSRSEEHTSELQSHSDLVCRLLLEKKKTGIYSRLSRGSRVVLKIAQIVREKMDGAGAQEP